MTIETRIEELAAMNTPRLRLKFAEVFGEETRSNNKAYLVKRIAWRIQEQAEGGLSERARKRAHELANDADLRTRAPSSKDGPIEPTAPVIIASLKTHTPGRRPMPGSLLVREYQGRRVTVRVLEKGFEYEGKLHRSLSAVANIVTGGHCSGARFFGLQATGVKEVSNG